MADPCARGRHHARPGGSAALVVLTLQTIPSVGLGLGYIALFGLGSIAGMALLSIVIAVPLRLSSGYLTRVHHAMTALVGVFSCALGIAMLVQVRPPERAAGLKGGAPMSAVRCKVRWTSGRRAVLNSAGWSSVLLGRPSPLPSCSASAPHWPSGSAAPSRRCAGGGCSTWVAASAWR
jgi:hypothetical protein